MYRITHGSINAYCSNASQKTCELLTTDIDWVANVVMVEYIGINDYEIVLYKYKTMYFYKFFYAPNYPRERAIEDIKEFMASAKFI